MGKPKTEPGIDMRTLGALLAELRELHHRVGAQLDRLNDSAPLSETYVDRLSGLYSLLTGLESLAHDLKSEIDRLDDQLPED